MNRYRACLFLVSAVVLLTGCELVVEFDRSKIDAGSEPPDGAAGGGGSAGGGGETAGEGDGGGLDDGAVGDAEVDGAVEPGVDAAVDAGDAGDAGEPEGFEVSGEVSGLASGNSVTLRINDSENVTVDADGSYAFPTALADGTAYDVVVRNQPTNPNQTCTVANHDGTIDGEDVTDVDVTCVTNTYDVGGSVSGLASGNSVVLRINDSENVTVDANASYAFPTALADGSAYNVVVHTPPTTPNQTCTISNRDGTVAGVAVTNVNVTCITNTYTVGGTVTGLTGAGLVLQNNGGDNLNVYADAGSDVDFTFDTAITDGLTYSVTVHAQPTSPEQFCSVTSGGSGAVAGDDVTDVVVTCATGTYPVGGTVSGLEGTGLILQNNGTDDEAVTEDGPFTFSDAITDGLTYNVTVYQPPTGPNQDCSVTNGSGPIDGEAVTDVLVECVTLTYNVGGTVTGLAGGESVTLQNNGTDDEAVTEDGPFTFSDAITDGLTYNVTVLTQPSTQTCTVTSHTGTLAGDAVTDVLVTCAADTYTVGGDVTGLVGTGLVLRLIDTHDEAVTDNSPYTFDIELADGTPYVVVVKTQPTDQYCTVANESGTISGDAVTDADVTCGYSVGGTINVTSPPLGAGLVLQNNGGDDLSVPAGSTAFTFDVAYSDSSSYSVSVLTNPAGHTCSIGGGTGSGTISSGNVTSVVVNCVPP